MRLDSLDGIRCDFCEAEFKGQFIYYSIDVTKRHVVNNYLAQIDSTMEFYDLCEACNAQTAGLLIQVRRRPKDIGILCDFTGQILNGTFDYYHLLFTKVFVSPGLAAICQQCQSPVNTADAECSECKHNVFSILSEVKTDPQHYELLLSGEGVRRWLNKKLSQPKSASPSTP